jgi:hypothetical protein
MDKSSTVRSLASGPRSHLDDLLIIRRRSSQSGWRLLETEYNTDTWLLQINEGCTHHAPPSRVPSHTLFALFQGGWFCNFHFPSVIFLLVCFAGSYLAIFIRTHNHNMSVPRMRSSVQCSTMSTRAEETCRLPKLSMITLTWMAMHLPLHLAYCDGSFFPHKGSRTHL